MRQGVTRWPRKGPGRHDRVRGAAVIEFALTVVFLLILTVGVTEIGRAFWYFSALQKAVREGARCLSNLQWLGAAATDQCRQLVMDDANAAAVRPVLNLSNVEISCDGAACAWGAGAAPEYVRVDVVNYRMAWLWNIGGGPLPPPEPLSGPAAGPAISVQATMPYMR